MNERKNNGKGIFYGVIGVATLVVAVIGATFAYFTATQSVNNVITGNMATVSLDLTVAPVTQADIDKGGLIPMSNSMVEPAVSDAENQVCIDDNGNAVCQVYSITITNSSTAGQFVDGYVALRGGSGKEPTDTKTLKIGTGDDGDIFFSYVDGAKFDAAGNASNGTTMRWAQVFRNANGTYKDAGGASQTEVSYSTTGEQILGTASEKVDIALLANPGTTGDAIAHNHKNIRYNNSLSKYWMNAGTDGVKGNEDDVYYTQGDDTGILGKTTIAGTEYNVIATNFVRTSNHTWNDGSNADSLKETYSRELDTTSALVFNHSLAAGASHTYYIVVWLSETGTDQTPGASYGATETEKNPAAADFFMGDVTFVSAQGSEVSATFSGFTKVDSQAQ